MKIEVTRDDEAELFRKGFRALKEQHKADEYANKAARAEAERNAQYGIAERVFFVVTRVPTREGQPDRFRAEAVSGLPDPSMSVVAYGTSPDDALFEARFHLADAIFSAHVEPDWESARHRAARAVLEIADLQGF